jgi:PTS system cellobiose-specific IIB component
VNRVLIVCGAGASSTFLAVRLRRAAKARDLDLVVDAGTVLDLEEQLAETHILLVGPHLRPRFDDVAERASQAGAVAALLPDSVFGAAGAEIAADIVTELLAVPSTPIAPDTAEQTQEIHHG